jgi:RimJ/RimL family protein N-acetyltransferase
VTFDRQPTLTSDVLVVRPLVEDDFESLRAIAADPLLWEQHPAKERATPEGFRAWMDDAVASSGALTALDAVTGEVVGTSRYVWRGEEMEVGWTFVARSRWGDGTNAELKRLMLGHAFASVDHVIFRVHEHNWRSQAAVRKLGADHDRNEGEAVVFRLGAPA